MKSEYQGRILIVEDDAELRFILGAHLRAAGFEVHEATDGRSAMELTKQSQPDLIIMDVGLPGMDGISVTRTLKADTETAKIPVIMLTARSRSEDVVAGLDAGAQEYLFKPFDVAELLARVRTVHRLAQAHHDLDRLNLKLEAEVDAKTRRLRLLYEFMRDLNHADSRDEILDLLIRCVQQTIRVQRISLFLRDSGGQYLVCERSVGVDPASVPKLPIKSVQGITGQVFSSGKTFAARAIGASLDGERNYARDAFVSTPLMTTSLETPDGVIGVLNVTERETENAFSDDEIECIRSMADATAIALDNET